MFKLMRQIFSGGAGTRNRSAGVGWVGATDQLAGETKPKGEWVGPSFMWERKNTLVGNGPHRSQFMDNRKLACPSAYPCPSQCPKTRMGTFILPRSPKE
ncbi:hypothetical protein PAHAL_J042000 [Panicum hallii]|uniref:Uncharacterized protein n=1 Tax=Panicum hallii TaxID=206008 RepID=A0A2T7AA48_9POAL|nr:hypothetical protein PAHAL_J042000 [Panicum hallii]